ncbi:hypothetical protein [Luteimonas sp. 3794]|uniref:hypothetical protein n=1 Tax=Luteimonas sp. 3794 TaxID=2817730 RepID=UPI00286C6905|nr:hypothetical protein [Luteimonas sp. 3794]
MVRLLCASVRAHEVSRLICGGLSLIFEAYAMHVDSDDSIHLFKHSTICASWQRCGCHLTFFATLVAGLSFVGPAVAQDVQVSPENTNVQAAAPVPSSTSAKVCRFEDVTGSRMRKRVCHTPEQWDARERAAQAAVRELDGKSVAGSEDGN